MKYTSFDVERRGVVTIQVPPADCLLDEWRSWATPARPASDAAQTVPVKSTHASSDPNDTDIRTSLRVRQMDCPAEMLRIHESLKGVRGLRNVDLDMTQRRITVVHSPEALKSILRILSNMNVHAELPACVVEDDPRTHGARSRFRQLVNRFLRTIRGN
ncbi:copper-translocating P-type ATPase [Pandoraea anhela]|uniref:Copper-translocating P-type ATPase n=2 Tax=Pandoraea anhela TaxID=2508295 RepID=A0A5E4WC17_9BURK|nr:copper-translocating P-type ATPase [Pandoraea anhela]